MLTVEHYGQIRRAHRDGMSIREIARTLHHSRRKIREVLQEPEPRPYTRLEPVKAPKLGPFQPIIDEILKADEDAPRKQRHTGARIFRRLTAEHSYSGGYSVPRRYAFQSVTVKAYVDRIEIVSAGAVIAEHPRSYEPDRQILDPLHYLATLTRKPGCLDHAPLYRDWQLPASFTQLRNRLEVQHGPRAGSRHFIRVLQLLGQHPIERIASVLDRLTENTPVSAEQIISRVERLGEKERATLPDSDAPTLPSSLASVRVPLPDLSRFNQFLSCGEQTDVEFTSVAEDQPQAVATAHDVCRV